jgi:soluble lytic murein transglycosylase-like protein
MPGAIVPARTPHRAAIERAAAAARLDADLVEALVIVESSGNPYAWNPEPRYRYLWDVARGAPFRKVTLEEAAAKWPPPDFPMLAGDRDQEWWGQQASWGLLQVMGAVARERGFHGPYLPELVDIDLNLRIGCRHLAALLAWAKGDRWKACAAYNAGFTGWDDARGQAYVSKVKRAFGRVTGVRA